MSDDLSNPTPQFKTAEFAGQSSDDLCESCGQSITDSYYRVNGALSCPSCAEKAKFQAPAESGGFLRGLVFGAGAALVGLVLYAAFAIITGWVIGYVSLAVGFIVGKAVMMGSGGVGGRRFQITAAALTYAAVSVAAVPIAISHMAKGDFKPAEQVETAPAAAPSEKDSTAADSPATAGEDASKEPEASIGVAVGFLILLGLASPFLELASPASGLIGLVILFVGIHIAWRITAATPLDILGPFHTAGASGQPSAG